MPTPTTTTRTLEQPLAGRPFRMIPVEGGVFAMGGESWRDDAKPIHSVEVSDFWIGEIPVTQALWEAVLGPGSNPSTFRGRGTAISTSVFGWCWVSLQAVVGQPASRKQERPRGANAGPATSKARPPKASRRLPVRVSPGNFPLPGDLEWLATHFGAAAAWPPN